VAGGALDSLLRMGAIPFDDVKSELMLDRAQYRAGAVWNSGALARELAPQTAHVVDERTAQRLIASHRLCRQ